MKKILFENIIELIQNSLGASLKGNPKKNIEKTLKRILKKEESHLTKMR